MTISSLSTLKVFDKISSQSISSPAKISSYIRAIRSGEVYAKRPQIQEQLTGQVADALMEHLNPKGVIVMMEAEHMCMTMRGVKKPGSKTVTFAMRGAFEENESLVNRFFACVK